jgi:O-antigen/teichoic acid export membrane protein
MQEAEDVVASGVPRDVLDTERAGGLVIRGGVIRAAGYVIATALSVLSYSLVTRLLGVERFGDYQTALSIVAIVATMTDAGMSTVAVREYTTLQGAARHRLMRNLLGARIGLTTVGVATALGVAATLGFDAALVAGTALAGIGVGLNAVQSMVAVPLAATLRVGTATVLETGRQALLVMLIVVVVLSDGGALMLLAATVPAGLVGLVATAAVLREDAVLRPAVHGSEWRRLFVLTLPMALAISAGTLYVYLVQVLTDSVASAYESGLFAAAFRVYLVIGAVPGLVVATAFPLLSRAARDDHARLAYAVDRLFRTNLLAGGLVAIVLSVGAPAAIAIVAGDGFRGSIPVLRIQAATLLISFALAPVFFALLSLRRHREIVAFNAVALVISAGGCLVLAPEFGARGAAWATVGGETALFLTAWAVVRRRMPFLAPGVAAIRPVVLPLTAGVAVAVLVNLPTVPAAALAGAVYVAVALVTRAVPAELRELVVRPRA